MLKPEDIVLLGNVAAQAPSTGPSEAGFHPIGDRQNCGVLYAVHHVEKLRPPRTRPPLARGTMIHIGLAHHYGALGGFPWAKNPFEAMLEAPEDIAYTYEECRAALEHYFNHYRVEPFRVVAVEREFRVSIRGYLYTARLDLVVEEAGQLWILEHKSSSEIRSVKEWQRNGQIIGQVVLARRLFEEEFGLPFGGLRINAIRTGEIRDCKRQHITLSERAIQRWPNSIYRWLQQIEREEKEFGPDAFENWPESHTHCQTRYGYCELYEACNLGRWVLADWKKST